MRHRWVPSPVALLIGAVIVLLSIGGYFFLQHSVDRQKTALLSNETTDAGETASSVFGGIITGVSNNAAVVKLTKADPTAFVNFVNPSGKVSRMPRRTGIEVLQALDSPPNVILMSAYRFEGEDKRSVGHKVFSHLMKPVAPRQLLDEVRAAIDRETA